MQNVCTFLRRTAADSADQFRCRDVVHQGEGKPFPAQVLQRGPDVVHLIVNEQKPVMSAVEVLHDDRVILRIMAVDVQLQLLADMLRVYRRRHACCPLVEHRQHRIVNIVVYQHNATLCLANQFAHKAVGIEYLTVEKDSLHRRLIRPHEEVYLLLMV